MPYDYVAAYCHKYQCSVVLDPTAWPADKTNGGDHMSRIVLSGLQVDSGFAQFVEQDVLPGLGLSASQVCPA